MEDTSSSKNLAIEVAKFLEDHKGLNTVALYIGNRSSFTDCFVITTATSDGHMRGLYKNVIEMLAERKIGLLHRRKNIDDEGWLLLDCGNLIIHLMNEEKRAFYDLERLWFEGESLFQSSSKSS